MKSYMRKYEGKVAIITGAGNGLGLALCESLLEAGAIVYALDIDIAALDRLSTFHPGECVYTMVCDVSSYDSISFTIKSIFEREKRVDFMFNNAGIVIGGETQYMDIAQWEKIVGINTMGVIYGTQFAYSIMSHQGFGHIVNTASAAGIIPVPYSAAYTTTKHAVVGLSLSLASEAQSRGIQVSVLILGTIETSIFKHAINVNGYDYSRRMHSRWIKLLTPQAAAKKVLEKVSKARTKIIVPASLNIVIWLYRLFPRTTLRLMRRFL